MLFRNCDTIYIAKEIQKQIDVLELIIILTAEVKNYNFENRTVVC